MLRDFLDALDGTFGARYMLAYRALKQYLERIDDETFRRELTSITAPRYLSYLYAAGLSYARQQMVSERWHEIIKQSEGGV